MLVKINEDGSKVSIGFQHVTKGKDKRTVCRIFTILPTGEKVLLNDGVARCSMQDVFSKETGRLLALTRALRPMTKEFRTQAWEAYWNRGRNYEQEFISAYIPDTEGLSHADALAMAHVMDNNAASTLAQSIEAADG